MRSRRHLPGLALGSALLLALGLWAAAAITGEEVVAPVPTRGGDGASARSTTLETGGEESAATAGTRMQGGPSTASTADDGPVLRGRLHQQETGEPLPWYHLELRAHRHTRVVRTDAEGRFELPFPPGLLQVSFHDLEPVQREGASISFLDLEQRAQLEHRAGDGPVRLEVSSGPTFDLDLPIPEGVGVGAMWAELTWRRTDFAGSPIWYEPLAAPLRSAGGGTWVRFEAPGQGSRNGPWGLAVYTHDEFWRSGEAQTERVQGRYPQVLRLELLPRGWLTVRARHGGAQETKPVVPLLTPIDRPPFEVTDRGVVHQRHGKAHALADGWLFTQLEEGAYALTFDTALHEPYSARVEVAAHAHTEHDAELVRLEIGGAITGTVSGRRDAQPARRMLLTREDGQGSPRAATIDWRDEDGRAVGSFAFDEVPLGRYSLVPEARSLHAWYPSAVLAEPPFQGAHFERLDGGPHAPVGFLVRDEAGQEITHADLRLTIRRQGDPPEAAAVHRLTSGKPHHLEFPLEAPVEWSVELPGHVSVVGHTEDFLDLRPTSFGECRFAEVVLRRK